MSDNNNLYQYEAPSAQYANNNNYPEHICSCSMCGRMVAHRKEDPYPPTTPTKPFFIGPSSPSNIRGTASPPGMITPEALLALTAYGSPKSDVMSNTQSRVASPSFSDSSLSFESTELGPADVKTLIRMVQAQFSTGEQLLDQMNSHLREVQMQLRIKQDDKASTQNFLDAYDEVYRDSNPDGSGEGMA